jgi:thioredoxin-related protein
MSRKWVALIALTAFVAYAYVYRPVESVVKWRTDLPSALAEAQERGTGVLIEFTSDSCPYCRQMEREVFPDRRVRSELDRFIPVQINIDYDDEIASQFGISGVPAYVALKSSGEPVLKTSGFRPAAEFTVFLRAAYASVSRSAEKAEVAPPADP